MRQLAMPKYSRCIHFALQQSEGSEIYIILEMENQRKSKHYVVIPNMLTSSQKLQLIWMSA